VVGSLAAALFIYRCAHRQAGLMIALFGTGPDAPYQRPWCEIRVTFWALDIATLFVLFFFLS
jgi:hypothetical protein